MLPSVCTPLSKVRQTGTFWRVLLQQRPLECCHLPQTTGRRALRGGAWQRRSPRAPGQGCSLSWAAAAAAAASFQHSQGSCSRGCQQHQGLGGTAAPQDSQKLLLPHLHLAPQKKKPFSYRKIQSYEAGPPGTGLFSKSGYPWDCDVGLPPHPRLLQGWRLRPAPQPWPFLLPSLYFWAKRPRSGTPALSDLPRQEWGRVPAAGPRLDKKGLNLQGYILQYQQTYISFAYNFPIWKCFALSSYFTNCTGLFKFSQLITNLISIWSRYIHKEQGFEKTFVGIMLFGVYIPNNSCIVAERHFSYQTGHVWDLVV